MRVMRPGCFNVGIMHRQGIATPKNEPLAQARFRQGCDLGDQNACQALGPQSNFSRPRSAGKRSPAGNGGAPSRPVHGSPALRPGLHSRPHAKTPTTKPPAFRIAAVGLEAKADHGLTAARLGAQSASSVESSDSSEAGSGGRLLMMASA